jgi:osmotically-inducible protein OsmY
MILPSQEIETVTDQDLERRVLTYLETRQIPGVRWIEVQADQGIVKLSGTVRTFYQKQLCTHCTRRVAGVVQVVDEISVA